MRELDGVDAELAYTLTENEALRKRVAELEAQVDTLRRCTVRLADDVIAFADDSDPPPTRTEFLRVVREVHELRATVAALMPGDAGHVR